MPLSGERWRLGKDLAKMASDVKRALYTSGLTPKRIFAISFMACLVLACGWLPGAPRRVIPTPLPELAIEPVEIPSMVCVGGTATLVVRTEPGNVCGGSIGYWNVQNRRVGIDLESIATDEEGLCTWTWRIPDDALPGRVEFRSTAEAQGNSRMLIEHFRVERCNQ